MRFASHKNGLDRALAARLAAALAPIALLPCAALTRLAAALAVASVFQSLRSADPALLSGLAAACGPNCAV